MTPRYAQRMATVQPSAIRELLALGADPSIISFGGDYPDATLFPKNQLDAVFHEIIRAPGGAAMQYAPSTEAAATPRADRRSDDHRWHAV